MSLGSRKLCITGGVVMSSCADKAVITWNLVVCRKTASSSYPTFDVDRVTGRKLYRDVPAQHAPAVRVQSEKGVVGRGGRASWLRHGVSGSGSIGLAVLKHEDLGELLSEADAEHVGHVHQVQNAIGTITLALYHAREYSP